MKLQITTVEPETIEEVVSYQQAIAGWEAFKSANPELFQLMEAHINDLEQKRQAADKAVRTADVSCGPIIQKTRNLKVNGDKLLSALGREEAIKCGAVISETRAVKVDMKRYEIAKAQGLVSDEIAEDVQEVGTTYSVPKELRLP